MHNPLSLLVQDIEKTVPVIEKYADPNKAGQLLKEIRSAAASQTMQVMLYGAYNAGKSSLINTIVGKEVANTADIPTTDCVDAYDWNGFTLLDTPGVNAPINHENVTQEQIKRSSLFLFVIREGDQDAKDIYERLFKILGRDKKVFIVLNHELSEKADLAKALVRMNEILADWAAKHEISLEKITSVPVFPINVRTAFKAIQKQSDPLLNHSGYTGFLEAFALWASIHDDKTGQLKKMQQQVNDTWFEPVLSELETKRTRCNDGDLKELERVRKALENEKRMLCNAALNKIRQEVTLVKGEISTIIQNAENVSAGETSLQQLLDPVAGKVESWLNEQMEEVRATLAINAQNDSLPDAGPSGSNIISDAVKMGLGSIKQEQIKDALLLGRKLKIPYLKGRWTKTLDKWAGKATVVLQVALAIWEVYDASEQQDKRNEANRQSTLSLHQTTEQIALSAINDLNSLVSELITTTFNDHIAKVQERIDTIQNNAGELDADYEVLDKARNKVLALGFVQPV